MKDFINLKKFCNDKVIDVNNENKDYQIYFHSRYFLFYINNH